MFWNQAEWENLGILFLSLNSFAVLAFALVESDAPGCHRMAAKSGKIRIPLLLGMGVNVKKYIAVLGRLGLGGSRVLIRLGTLKKSMEAGDERTVIGDHCI